MKESSQVNETRSSNRISLDSFPLQPQSSRDPSSGRGMLDAVSHVGDAVRSVVVQSSGVALLLFASCMTSGVDPWATERKRSFGLSMHQVFNPLSRVRRRKISLATAKLLASQIMEKAEERRRLAVDREARAWADWEA